MSSNKTVNDKCCIRSKLVKKVSGTPKTLLTEQDIDEFSTAFDIDFVTGDIVCGKCRLELHKKRKVNPGANGSDEYESESIVSELLERTESSLSQMTLSQSSSEDPSFRANITSTDDGTEYIEMRNFVF
ncbi:hypothetical protein KQX54_012676 [Cotesia glomerata]|uniref:Uncharacterized protein n=1 Tax=Cotesia glomerata TaxID=32391 RepID=A0AAV7HZR8_COTGL|nr:hypothetical protein KQX54_012676 [Cotesia glomerata]